MRFIRLEHLDQLYYADLMDDHTARLWTGPPWAGGEATDRLAPLKPGKLRCPVTPSKIVCVGRNYRAHAEELGNDVPKEPLLFLKPPSALVGPEAAIELPAASKRVEHEGELGVVIGKRCRDVSATDAMDRVFGLHLRERRDCPRHPAGRCAVHPRQGVRHVLPSRASHRNGVSVPSGY